MGTRVLIVGVSTRAIVESAVRAGHVVTSLDAYADLDQPAGAATFAMPRDAGASWSPSRAARFARDLRADVVVYGSNWENHPRALATLARERVVWGNEPACLRRVRDPLTVRAAFLARGVPAPDVRMRPSAARSFPGGATWLRKPLRSGGGHGIRCWDGTSVPDTHYLQRRIEGAPGSVTFVAARGRAVVLGVTTQLVGDLAFGTTGYRYCGSVLWSGAARNRSVDQQAERLATVAAEAFQLTGVGSVDFIYRDGVMHPIEVNPRWTASLELVERACGVSVFAAHAAACRDAVLPAVVRAPRSVCGKAVVFARHPVVARDTARWLSVPHVRDVPRPATLLARGAPVCTVFAAGADEQACRARLRRRAEAVHDQLAGWKQEAA